jgi:exopolysaccharide biosynthesis polyprenyl glycosylphosphotransferase
MAWIAMIDMVCLVAGGAIGVLSRFEPDEMGEYVFGHLDGFIVFAGSVILANYLAGSYRMQYTFSRFNLLVTWLFALFFSLLMLSFTSYAWFKILIGRGVLFLSVAWYSVFSLVFKQLFFRSLFRSAMFVCRTVVIGDCRKIPEIRRVIENEWVLPMHKLVACVHVDEAGDSCSGATTQLVDGTPVMRVPLSAVEDVIRSLGASLIVLAEDDPERAKARYPKLRRLRFEGVEVISELGLSEIYSGRISLALIDEEYLMDISMESGLPVMNRAKRLMDIFFSLLAVVVFLPVMLAVALVVKLADPRSPVIYAQNRVGQFGKVFRIYKFRTMRADAESESGPVWSAPDDARVTRVGRFLRKFRLDELPQFFNVLSGDMSLVGPRPERSEMIAELEKDVPFYNERLNVMPGLTGWAQIRYPYGNSVEDAARKLEYDLYYIKNMSVSLDIQIMLSTIRIMLFGREKSV